MSTISQRVQALLKSTIVWDNHACAPLKTDAQFLQQFERYRTAGASVVSINVGYGRMEWEEHLTILSFMRQWFASRPDGYRLVATLSDVYRCKEEGKLGIVFDVEGMYPIQDDVIRVRILYELGVRWMLIAYNKNNSAGGGCLDEDCGLTDVGRAVIDEMERVGMVLCLSHAGARTVADAIEYSTNPVIFSHSNPYGDSAHPRNVADDLLRACARTGGVVGLSGIGPFLGTNDQLVERLLLQIRYVIDLVGPEHVGLGLDYVLDRTSLEENVRRNPGLYPAGITGSIAMVEPECLGEIAEGLARYNFTDEQIRGVLGENWLRIAKQVWR